MEIILTVVTLTFLSNGQYIKTTEEVYNIPSLAQCEKLALHFIMLPATNEKKIISAGCLETGKT